MIVNVVLAILDVISQVFLDIEHLRLDICYIVVIGVIVHIIYLSFVHACLRIIQLSVT
jgi:hypothetical protein